MAIWDKQKPYYISEPYGLPLDLQEAGKFRRIGKVFHNKRNRMYGVMLQNPDKKGKFGEWEMKGMFKTKAEANKKLKEMM